MTPTRDGKGCLTKQAVWAGDEATWKGLGPPGLRAALGRQEPRVAVTSRMLDDRGGTALQVSKGY